MATDFSLFGDEEPTKKDKANGVSMPGPGPDLSLFEDDSPQFPPQNQLGIQNYAPSVIKEKKPIPEWATDPGAVLTRGNERLGRNMLGGILNIAESVATLPLDIMSVTGPNKEQAKVWAQKIKAVIPNIDPNGTFDTVIQKFTQYGVPATSAIKLTAGIVKGAPWAIRFTSELFSGGLSDFLVASPEDKTLLFDAKSPLGRRAAVGAEGTLYPAILRSTIGVPKALVKGGSKFVKFLYAPHKVAEDAVAAALVDGAIDPIKGLAEIKKVLREGTIIKPTTGIASGDPGIIGLEKGVSSAQDTSATMLARKELNMENISDALEGVTNNMGGNGEKAKDYFKAYVNMRLSGKENAIELVEAQLKSVENETDNILHEFAMQQGRARQAEASIILDDTLRQELERLTKKKNLLYWNIDPEREVKIPKERLEGAYKKLIKKSGPLDTTVNDIPAEIKTTIASIFKAPKISKPAGFIQAIEPIKEATKPLYFGDLQDLRPVLSDAIATARQNNQGGAVKRLVEFKVALENETDELAKLGGEAANRARDAQQFYQNEFVPKFKEGVGGRYRKAIMAGAPVEPSAVGKKFVEKPTGSMEAASQLDTIVKGAENAQEASVAVRDHIVGTVADLMQTTSGKTSIDRLDKYLNQRSVRETLSKFPAIENEIKQFRNSLGKSINKQGKIAQDILEAKNSLGKTQKDLEMSATRFWVESDPTKAMQRTLNSPDSTGSMNELVRLAKRDPSGDAILGLRQSLSDYIEETVRGTTQVGNVQEVMRGKIVKLLQNKSTRDAIAVLYSPSEMKILDQVRDELQMMNGINKQVTTGSPTAPIAQQVQRTRVILASFYGIVKGRGIFAISDWIMRALGRDPKTIANQVLTDAMLNPELASVLMTKNLDSKIAQDKAKSYLTTYILNNLVEPITQDEKY